MSKSPDRRYREADAAIERAVTTLMSAIDLMMGRWDGVSDDYILERVLLKLCDELTKLIDDQYGERMPGPATLALSNALADYRDSLWKERG